MFTLPWINLILGLTLSVVIGALGYWGRTLSPSGALGAVLVGTATFGFGGWSWGLLLVAFFVTSSLLSYWRAGEKEHLAEKFAKGGMRDLAQALANGGLGAFLAVLSFVWPSPLWAVAFVGAIAAVSADTWATELGVLSTSPPRLITTWRKMPVGTSGGVTPRGLLASLVGALTVGLVAQVFFYLSGLQIEARLIVAAVFAGLAGSLADSLLGATAQGIYFCPQHGIETEKHPFHTCGTSTIHRRGWKWLDNDGVNFLGSLVGAFVAALFWLLGS